MKTEAKIHLKPKLSGRVRSADGRSWTLPETAAERRAYIRGRWPELRAAGHKSHNLLWTYLTGRPGR